MLFRSEKAVRELEETARGADVEDGPIAPPPPMRVSYSAASGRVVHPSHAEDVATIRDRAAVHGSVAGTKIGRCERAILIAIAQRSPKTSTKSQVAILSGYSLTSSSFANGLGALRSTGWIEGNGEALAITEEGFRAAAALHPDGRIPKIPSGERLREHWEGKLGRPERIFLQVLAGAPGRALTKERLASVSGYSITSSSFANALGTLRTLELVSRGEPIRLAADLAG